MSVQPLDNYHAPVEAAWIDYNGHMNVAYYVLMFDRATDTLLDRLGLGAAYRRRTNHSIYVLEAHITYEREVKEGDVLRFTSQLVDADERAPPARSPGRARPRHRDTASDAPAAIPSPAGRGLG